MSMQQEISQLYKEKDLEALEKKLDVVFKNKDLLIQAVSRKAHVKELLEKDPGCTRKDNERLEFLGDSVLEMTVRKYFYDKIPDEKVGVLAPKCIDNVKRWTLARVASEFGLSEHLFLTETEERVLRRTPRILADSLEAVIGAVYLETDYERTTDVVLERIFQGQIGKIGINPEDINTQ